MYLLRIKEIGDVTHRSCGYSTISQVTYSGECLEFRLFRISRAQQF
jgi:hypothetical protein